MSGTGNDLADGQDAPSPARLDVLRGRLLDPAAVVKLPPPEPLIDGLLFLNSLAWLHGKPGSGKSLIALDWAACVGTGLPWQGREVTQGGVLYVVAEGTSGLPQRVAAWEDHAGTMTGVQFLPEAVQIANGDSWSFAELAAELRPRLIVLDTQARVSVGMEENSAKDMGRLIDAGERVRERSGACVLFVHHEPRNGENMRGSTALEGGAVTEMRTAKDDDLITLSCLKQKDAAEFGPIRLALQPRLDSVVVVRATRETSTAASSLMSHWLATFDETVAVSVAMLVETSKLSRATVYRAIKDLVSDGSIVNVGTAKQARYKLAGGD
jgi:AAA domain